MIWARWRERAGGSGQFREFHDLLGEAPVMVLLLDAGRRVLAANLMAQEFFGIDPSRLPRGLLDVTREGRLMEALPESRPDHDLRLTHRQRTVRTRAVTSQESGETLLYMTDVTDLRRLETVRQEFVANLSHELRTPIASLRLAAEGLAEDLPEEARMRFAERVLTEADHVAAVVTNLKLLAEIESGVIAIHRSRFPLRELVDDVVDRLRLDGPLERYLPPGLVVTADRDKLAQALANLLDNAVKFSPPDLPVEISAEVPDGELLLSVRDHGPGISPEHWSRVFERFYKVDPARTREAQGSGLGLAITKHLALAMGGRVWTEAAREGGQVFVIAIPTDPEARS
jgi:two-component system phosphate regulon sensor histidine kinase PhoR